jgi:ADP-ribosylglycohydrolase
MSDNPSPYNSYGNGSAMRVSAVGFAFESVDRVLEESKRTAEVTHNHPEGIKGAQATASAVFMARNGFSKQETSEFISGRFSYDLDFNLNDIRPDYVFDVSCQGSVPQAIVAFLESNDFEHAIRLAVSIGGDSDTIACIAGAIAAGYYKTIPQHIIEVVLGKLPDDLKQLLIKFEESY